MMNSQAVPMPATSIKPLIHGRDLVSCRRLRDTPFMSMIRESRAGGLTGASTSSTAAVR